MQSIWVATDIQSKYRSKLWYNVVISSGDCSSTLQRILGQLELNYLFTIWNDLKQSHHLEQQ